ncbi:hypothetical protein HRI_001649500 [Hibiscus trionum]|uniref:Endonuclease/exonuclease/phosphatase domain-containing protein n=1 Tax=Hibiscus trionum TaxID=183268 RepID=A0A9W7LW04_HIBTR|nr:hypothetical protein HRI_001649500 [Hibiscus trionum]
MYLGILSWNVRGLGRHEKVRAVRKTIWACKAGVILLQETKLDSQKVGVCKRLRGNRFGDYAFSPEIGSAGGLLSLWDASVFVEDNRIAQDRVIIILGTLVEAKLRIGVCNVYDPNDQSERTMFWSQLKALIDSLRVPIIMGGDFNAVRTWEEKLGTSVSGASMRTFDSFIIESNMVDLPLVGGKFTWMRGGSTFSASRIDRFLLSPVIVERWPNLGQFCLPRSLSDHSPILLKVDKGARGPQPFKYFDYWADESSYFELVSYTISSSSGLGVGALLKKVKAKSKEWVM